MRRLRCKQPLLLALAAVLASCGGKEGEGTRAALSKPATIVVQPGETHDLLSWEGVIEAIKQAQLAAQTSGRVSELAVDVNDRVRAGDVLLRITSVEQRASAKSAAAELRAAEAVAAEAERNHQRATDLAARKLISAAEIDRTRAALGSARAGRDAARARLAEIEQQASYTEVRAPYDGTVSARNVELGETVSPNQHLLSLYASQALRVRVDIPQTQAAMIRIDPKAVIVLDDGRRLDADRVTVFDTANPIDHSVTVRASLPAINDPPAPGTTAKVGFASAAADARLRIPSSSLVQRGEVSAVYVWQQDRLLLRQLRIGRFVDSEVEVLSGLKPGEEIAADPIAATRALIAQRRSHD